MAKIQTNIVGGFSFRDEGDGCIHGKYINTGAAEPFPEACKRKDPSSPNAPFVGRYDSVWLQANSHHAAELAITITPPGRYRLIWTLNSIPTYEGVGMLVGGMLVGGYWQV